MGSRATVTALKEQAAAERYGWAYGTRHKVHPAAAAQAFRALHAQGAMTPEGVVRHATDPGSPFHPEIMWDNQEAADRYRLMQAGALLRHLVVSYKQVDDTYSDPIRYTVKLTYMDADDRRTQDDPALEPHVYVPLREAMANPQHRERAMYRALHDFLSLRRKYRDYEVFARIFDEIDKVREQFDLEETA